MTTGDRANPLATLRVVLVRPQFPRNMGAVARLMRNFGVNQLTLVEPQADPFEAEALRTSTHGEAILRSAQVVATLEEAIRDCVWVLGTSARQGGTYRRQSAGFLDEQLPDLVASLGLGSCALVFGPEQSGLANEEVARFNGLLHLEAGADYPVLNLSHAVAITLHALYVRVSKTDQDVAPTEARDEPAPFQQTDAMFSQLHAGLEKIGYLRGDRGEALFHGIRHLIGRARPTIMEAKLLLGLARQLEWYCNTRGETDDKCKIPDGADVPP